MKAEKIHLVPLFECDSKMRYYLATFTWNEFGISEVTTEGSLLKWRIGSADLYVGYFLKLSAFITF